MDENLDELQGRAATNAVRYGRIAAAVLGVVAAGAVAFVVYRKTRKPTLRDRLDGMSLESLRELVDDLSSRLKEQLPSVTVKVNEDQPREPGTFEAIIRKVALPVLGTASTAVLDRVARSTEPDTGTTAPSRAADR